MNYKTTQDLLTKLRECTKMAAANGTNLWRAKREMEAECTHIFIPCRWETSNSVQRAALMCTVCGYKETNGVKKADYPNFAALPWYDESIKNGVRDYENRLRDWLQEQHEKRRTEQDANWFKKHTAYLRSPEWAERRANVLRRDGYICQACLQNPANQVHHLSYDHWGHEPLFDLTSVCKPCHNKLTAMDRNRRNGQKSEPEILDYRHEVQL